jgi:hypothetical protein
MDDIGERVAAAWRKAHEYMEHRRKGTREGIEDPQPTLAKELFQMWQRRRDADGLADRALIAAFQMWANAGQADEIEAALSQLNVDAPYWGSILNSVQRAYTRDARGTNAVLPLLHSYEDLLTHAVSRSALYELLGMHYWMANDVVRARGYYSNMARLAVDSVTLERAAGAIYEQCCPV